MSVFKKNKDKKDKINNKYTLHSVSKLKGTCQPVFTTIPSFYFLFLFRRI